MENKPRYEIREHGPKACEPTFAQIESYSICQWCPTPDGSGKPEAVVVTFEARGLALTINGSSASGIGLRLKSRHAINTFIEILERHRDEVFPRGDE